LADIYPRIEQRGFRIARPLPTHSGVWVVEGWWAQERLAGAHETGRWQERVDACRDFHAALQALERPAFLALRTHPWAGADRAAGGETGLDCHERLAPAVGRLAALLAPVSLLDQLIHGDFGGNLLIADGLPPAVIDMSPYWRPAGFALAVVLVDAIVWGAAPPGILDLAAGEPQLDQLLVRAALRRILELDQHFVQFGDDHLTDIDAYAPLLTLIERRFQAA
jgi:uncharacterized protein (TIGR02569 family)